MTAFIFLQIINDSIFVLSKKLIANLFLIHNFFFTTLTPIDPICLMYESIYYTKDNKYPK